MLKNYPVVMQESVNECGLCSLLMILRYHGINVSKYKLQRMVKLSKNGTTALNLINASKRVGLNAKGVTCEINKLDNKYLPIIAHTVLENNYLHYIVIYNIDLKKGIMEICDPNDGLKKITIEEFKKISSNIFLIFEKTKIIKNKDMRINNILKKIVLENKKNIIILFSISVLVIFLSLMFSLFLKLILQYYDNYKIIYVIIFTFLLISLIKNLLNYLKSKIINKLSFNIDKKINEETYKHLFLLPYSYLSDKEDGELFSIVGNLSDFKDTIINIYLNNIINYLMILGSCLFLIIINYHFILIIILLFIMYWIMLNYYKRQAYELFFKIKKSSIEMYSYLIESLSMIDTIKNLNIFKKITSKLNNNQTKHLDNLYKYNEMYNCLSFYRNIFNEIVFIGTIFILIILVNYHQVSIYDLVVFESIFYILNDSLITFFDNKIIYQNYVVSINKVLDLLDIPEEQLNENETISIKSIEGVNLSFAHNDQVIIDKSNFIINKGDKILLTGKSGSGKSTVAKLILKYFPLDRGEILINSQNLDDIDNYAIRDSVVYVSQNEKIYSDTLYNNIIMGDKYLNNLDEVCKISHVDELLLEKQINLNDYVIDQGSNLSGGEKKRLIIARSLLKNSDMIIFDETFNEIDESMEKQILADIFQRYKTKTIIVISHRTKNKDLFDKCWMLENKKIVEGG